MARRRPWLPPTPPLKQIRGWLRRGVVADLRQTFGPSTPSFSTLGMRRADRLRPHPSLMRWVCICKQFNPCTLSWPEDWREAKCSGARINGSAAVHALVSRLMIGTFTQVCFAFCSSLSLGSASMLLNVSSLSFSCQHVYRDPQDNEFYSNQRYKKKARRHQIPDDRKVLRHPLFFDTDMAVYPLSQRLAADGPASSASLQVRGVVVVHLRRPIACPQTSL